MEALTANSNVSQDNFEQLQIRIAAVVLRQYVQHHLCVGAEANSWAYCFYLDWLSSDSE